MNDWTPLQVKFGEWILGQRMDKHGYLLKKGMKTIKVSEESKKPWFFKTKKEAIAVCKKLNMENENDY